MVKLLLLMVLRTLCHVASGAYGGSIGRQLNFTVSRGNTDKNLLMLGCEDEDGPLLNPTFFRDGVKISDTFNIIYWASYLMAKEEFARLTFVPQRALQKQSEDVPLASRRKTNVSLMPFKINRMLEGRFSCGRGNTSDSNFRTLIAYPDDSIKPSYRGPTRGEVGTTIHLDCPISPGVLVEQYYVTWRSASDPSMVFYQSFPPHFNLPVINKGSQRYSVDPKDFSLSIRNVIPADGAQDYVCVLGVEDPDSVSTPLIYSQNVDPSVVKISKGLIGIFIHGFSICIFLYSLWMVTTKISLPSNPHSLRFSFFTLMGVASLLTFILEMVYLIKMAIDNNNILMSTAFVFVLFAFIFGEIRTDSERSQWLSPLWFILMILLHSTLLVFIARLSYWDLILVFMLLLHLAHWIYNNYSYSRKTGIKILTMLFFVLLIIFLMKKWSDREANTRDTFVCHGAPSVFDYQNYRWDGGGGHNMTQPLPPMVLHFQGGPVRAGVLFFTISHLFIKSGWELLPVPIIKQLFRISGLSNLYYFEFILPKFQCKVTVTGHSDSFCVVTIHIPTNVSYDVCMEVRETLLKTFANYSPGTPKVAFLCEGEHATPTFLHPAVVSEVNNTELLCTKVNDIFGGFVTDAHRVWLRGYQPTGSFPHLLLQSNKHHHTSHQPYFSVTAACTISSACQPSFKPPSKPPLQAPSNSAGQLALIQPPPITSQTSLQLANSYVLVPQPPKPSLIPLESSSSKPPVTSQTPLQLANSSAMLPQLPHILQAPPEPSSSSTVSPHQTTGRSHQPPAIMDRPKLKHLKLLRVGGENVRIIQKVATHWQDLADFLDFEYSVIEIIKEDRKHDSCEVACREMFYRWLEGEACQEVTWRRLIEALQDVAGLESFASRIQKLLLTQPHHVSLTLPSSLISSPPLSLHIKL